MKKTIFLLFLSLLLPSKGWAIAEAIHNHITSSKHKFDNFDSYSFKACGKYASESKDETSYYLICHEGFLKSTFDLRDLEGNIQAIEYDVLQNQFLRELKEYSILSLKEGIRELIDLKNCLVNKPNAEECEEMRLATLSSLRKDIPKVRSLLSMKGTSGHILSPVRPKRYKDENLEHDFTSVNIPPLTNPEKEYLNNHITNLELKFNQEALRDKEIAGLDQCVQTKSEDQLELINSSVCQRFEFLVNDRVNHLFKKQNMKYQEAYDSLVSNNPILSLLELSSEEPDQKILEEVTKKISILIENSKELLKTIEGYDEDERKKIIDFSGLSNKFLESSNASSYGCNIAEKLKRQYNKKQVRSDLLIAAGAIAGGGACALTFGVGCGLAVGIGSEVIAYNHSQSRYDLARKAFYSSQGDHEDLMQKLSDRNLTLFLAPLAVVGARQITHIGAGIRKTPSALKGVEKLSSKAKVLRDYKKFKDKGSLGRLKRLTNFSKLSSSQRDIFYDYLATFGNRDREIMMEILSESKNSKDFISRLGTEKVFSDLGKVKNLLKTFEKHYILPRGRFVIGQKYQVKLGESSRVRKMKFKDYIIDENGDGLFLISDNLGKKNHSVRDDMIAIKKNSSEPDFVPILVESDAMMHSPFLLTQKFTGTARLMYRPFLKYKDGNRVTFHADKVPSKEMKRTADTLMSSIEKFDESYEKLGFNIPDNTKVIFDDLPLVPSIGPHTYPLEVFNIWDGKSSVVIRMEPIIRKTKGVFDEGILLHERGHDILHATFNSDAFINQNTTYQEAFADFLYSLNKNVSKLGVGVTKEGVPVRDVGRREYGRYIDKLKMRDITDIENSPSHNNSLYISNTMWKLKNELGSEKVNELVGELLDNLNTHRSSFTDMRLFLYTKLGDESPHAIYSGKGRKNIDKQVKNFEYFFGVLRKTLVEQDSLNKNVELVLDSAIKEIGLNPKVIGNIQRKIKTDGVNYREQIGQASFNRTILVYGSIGAGIDGAAAYYLTKEALEFVQDSDSSDP